MKYTHTHKEHLSYPLSQEALESSFNSLVDAKNAIAIRQSIILTGIGFYIEQLATGLAIYNGDCGAISSINDAIHHIQAESNKHNFPINFYGLEFHRSTSSQHGLSFLQQQRSLRIQLEPFLNSTFHLRTVASEFILNPSSISAHPAACQSELQPRLQSPVV